jgi:16S rRNA (cytosine967-C5)-methyltransferase
VQAGERVAELCAGHGGKSALFLRQLGPKGTLCAVDLDERKLARIAPELARLGIDPAPLSSHAVDLTVGPGGLAPGFDRVFVDAPCSGLGTVHRRPELLLRLDPAQLASLGQVQLAIAERAARLLRPGGTLAYAVCSPLRQEGAEVATALERAVPDLRRLCTPATEKLPAPDADGVIRLGP